MVEYETEWQAAIRRRESRPERPPLGTLKRELDDRRQYACDKDTLHAWRKRLAGEKVALDVKLRLDEEFECYLELIHRKSEPRGAAVQTQSGGDGPEAA